MESERALAVTAPTRRQGPKPGPIAYANASMSSMPLPRPSFPSSASLTTLTATERWCSAACAGWMPLPSGGT